MNVACDYEAPMQMLTTEKYIASRASATDVEISAQPQPAGRPAIAKLGSFPVLALFTNFDMQI